MIASSRSNEKAHGAPESDKSRFGSAAVLRAFIFDMDGVVTNTAVAHFTCWKEVFDGLLRSRSGDDFGGDDFRDDAPGGDNLGAFTRRDYLDHVDGIPRLAGIRAFLESREIDLPEGEEGDRTPATVRGLGFLKNQCFDRWLAQNEVPTFEDTRALIDVLKANGVTVGIFSASRNANRVIESAGLGGFFDAIVSGDDAEEQNLAAKPDPAMLVETARQLGIEPRETAVVEDALAGVEAGSRGRFALTVGINRQEDHADSQRHALRAHGADLVVRDLRRLLTADGSGLRTVGNLPAVWDRQDELVSQIGSRPLAVFLDYDGTLTPIVRNHRKAHISDKMVEAVAQLAEQCPTAIISGRDLDDVRDRVGLDSVFYAGSHGFDIAGPGGLKMRPEGAEKFLRPIAEAEQDLRRAIEGIDGAEVERKTFSIAVHFRNAAEEDVERLESAVDEVVGRHADLRRSRGKKVLQVEPRAEWNKGKAIEWLLANTRLGERDALPLYIGDDITDEDAFAALADDGISIVVKDGGHITTADYALANSADVGRFLVWLSECVEKQAR